MMQAVESASFASRRKREREGFFDSDRIRPGDPEDAESFKVRRAKTDADQDTQP